MYLLVGPDHDAVCRTVGQSLSAMALPWRRLDTLFAETALSIDLDGPAARCTLRFDDGLTLTEADLSGVLIRTASGIDADGWNADDFAYASVEARSALIAWIWSLPCPVVNRFRPELWHRGTTSALAWRREVFAAGLSIKPHTVRCGHSIDASRGMPPESLMTPMTGFTPYEVLDRSDWERVSRLAATMPVTLAPRHDGGATACVACGEVIWATAPPERMRACEPGLARLATATGLDFMEVSLVPLGRRACVDTVNPWGALGVFEGTQQREIGVRLARALAAPRTARIPAYEEAWA